MNSEQILQLTNKELPRAAGEVLQPDFCLPCVNCYTCEDVGMHNTIELTPANQVKYRDWAVEKYGEKLYRRALEKVFTGFFLVCHAKPEHYIKAAMLCVEGSKG